MPQVLFLRAHAGYRRFVPEHLGEDAALRHGNVLVPRHNDVIQQVDAQLPEAAGQGDGGFPIRPGGQRQPAGMVMPQDDVGGVAAQGDPGHIPELKLELDVSEEELAERKNRWQPKEPNVKTGYLARYASMVTSGNRGAILEIPKS